MGILAAACSPTGVTTTSVAATTTTVLSPFFDGQIAEVTVGDVTLLVAVADTSSERSQGLMGVKSLGELDGMLFIHDSTAPVSYTMRNTLLPLDVWFIAEDGAIVGTSEMQPCSTEPCDSYPSPGPVTRVLETPQGDYEFAVGDVVSISEAHD